MVDRINMIALPFSESLTGYGLVDRPGIIWLSGNELLKKLQGLVGRHVQLRASYLHPLGGLVDIDFNHDMVKGDTDRNKNFQGVITQVYDKGVTSGLEQWLPTLQIQTADGTKIDAGYMLGCELGNETYPPKAFASDDGKRMVICSQPRLDGALNKVLLVNID